MRLEAHEDLPALWLASSCRTSAARSELPLLVHRARASGVWLVWWAIYGGRERTRTSSGVSVEEAEMIFDGGGSVDPFIEEMRQQYERILEKRIPALPPETVSAQHVCCN